MGRRILRGLGWVVGCIPALLVWAGLAGLFWYGAAHGWKFTEPAAKAEEKGKEEPPAPDAGEPGKEFKPYYQPQPHDVPVLVAHDPATCKACAKPITFKTPASAAKAGIKTAPVGAEPITVTITAHGEVVADPTATARVSPRLGGTLFALEKQLGDPVRRGDLLALVDSAEVGKAKAAYLTAKAHLESREQILGSLQTGAAAARSVVEAEAAVREARAGLYSARQGVANLGLPVPSPADEKLPDDQFTNRLMFLGVPFFGRLAACGRAEQLGQPLTANLLPVVSPLDGFVTRRAGVVGETVAAGQVIYEVGDPTRVDVFLDVRQEDLPRVKVGQAVTFQLEGGASLPATTGEIDWIGPTVDEKTRTVRVRARVANPGGMLKGGAFGGGTVVVEPTRQALVVPKDAVQWEGCSYLVFVKMSDTEFLPRKVTPGVRVGGMVEITAGLEKGDEVVVVGSHVLKCELLKDRIGGAEE